MSSALVEMVSSRWARTIEIGMAAMLSAIDNSSISFSLFVLLSGLRNFVNSSEISSASSIALTTWPCIARDVT
ncbi:hypothetical protein D3C81_1714700 [compost metagenome]